MRQFEMFFVIVLLLACIPVSVLATTPYDSKIREVFIVKDHIETTGGVKVTFGRYYQRETRNGQAIGAGTLILKPVNSWNASTDWTYLNWSGSGGVTFALRGADDNGNRMNIPEEDSWTDWIELVGTGKKLDIPDALDGKQFLQVKATLTDGAVIEEIQLHKRVMVPNHPRMIATAADFEAARKRAKENRFYGELLDSYKEFMDKHIMGSRYQQGRGPWQAGWYAVGLGMLYQFTGEKKYADEAKIQFERLGSQMFQGLNPLDYMKMGKFEYAELMSQLPIAYDLIYEAFTPAEREKYVGHLIRIAERIEGGWRFSDLSNQAYVVDSTPMLVGLACYGDSIQDEKVASSIRRKMDDAEMLMREHLVPASNLWAGDDGGWGEGHGYCSFTQSPWARQAMSYRSATGEDLFEEANFFRYLAQWRIWETRPYDGIAVQLNDTKDVKPSLPYPSFLAWRYQDAHAQYFADKYLKGARVRDGAPLHWNLWAPILFYDSELKAADTSYPTLPWARHFQGVGQVAFRPGWDEDAPFALFKCQHFASPGAHMHKDDNQFLIHRVGSLAIDSGVDQRANEHYPNYFQRTIAHNTVLVYDPNESVWRTVNDGGQYIGDSWKKTFGRFDSAQMGSFGEDSSLRIDGIIRFEVNDHYAYACGDATKAYNPKKVTEFIRQFVFLKPNIIVCFDRITSTNPSFEKIWLLHSINEPQRIDDAAVPGMTSRTCVVSEAGGKLFVRTLFPQNAKIEFIGGSGKEWWVRGTNYPPVNPNKAFEAGNWRIEISPNMPSKTDYFLHVMYPTSIKTPTMPKTKPISDETSRGVEFETDGKMYRVTFAILGLPAGHVRITDIKSETVLLDKDLTHTVEPQFFPPELSE